jgi:hypothetical protein
LAIADLVAAPYPSTIQYDPVARLSATQIAINRQTLHFISQTLHFINSLTSLRSLKYTTGMLHMSSVSSMNTRTLCLTLALAAAGTMVLPIATPAETTNLTATCAFDTESGKPNPLGLRAYITAVEIGGDTTFTYAQFPSNVAGDGAVGATIAQERHLTFYKTSVIQARQLMLKNPTYYAALVGVEDEKGYGAIDAILTCRGINGQPIQAALTIATLPDGEYRFWSGATRKDNVSDEELLKQGGILFVFSKKKGQVLGNIAPVDGESGVCVEGSVAGNTISGFATVPQKLETFNQGDTLEPLPSIPDGALQVRRGKLVKPNRVKFFSALLNLNGYSKISLGKSVVPKRCGD